MSRIGTKTIDIPKGVTVTVTEMVTVKGPKGELSRPLVDGTAVAVEGELIRVTRASDSRTHRANHGLMRSLVNNMVVGVSAGFERRLQILGVGYKAQSKDGKVLFNLGYSHPINYDIPAGITVDVDKANVVTIKGIDKEVVGQTAAIIRGFRPPDAYKGKGVRYEDEVIRLKAGKAAKA